MAATASVVHAGDLSLEESLLADLSNISDPESQRVSTQARAAVYWAGHGGVTEQQAKEFYQISHSPAPQHNAPPPPPSPPTSSPPDQRKKAPLSPIDRARAAACRARSAAPAPRPIAALPQPPPQPIPEPIMGSRSPGDHYWYRTSAGVMGARGASSTPSKSQSQSQSQSQPRTQANPPVPPQTQSPPASPPRATGTGLVHQFSQLSTSDESHEHGQVLVPGSSNEEERRIMQAGETQPTQLGEHVLALLNEPSQVDPTPPPQLNQTHFNVTQPPHPDETQPTQVNEIQLTHVSDYPVTRRSSSPSLGDPPRHQSPTSSISLGDRHSSGGRRSSPTPSARRSSPSLGGSPRRAFGDMNQSGGSSPPPLTSGLPTQEIPDSLGTQESDNTAPTELVTPELQYVSATPVLSGPSLGNRTGGASGFEGSRSSGGRIREGTPPTQISNPEPLQGDAEMQDADEDEVVPPTPEPATPLRPAVPSNPRTIFPSLASYARSIPQVPTYDTSFDPPASSSPARPLDTSIDTSLVTPLSHPHDAPHPLDRSRKSSFAPPVRRKPERQAPIPQLNIGRREIQFSQIRWDAARAEEEERTSRTRASGSRSPDRTPTRGQTPAGMRGMAGMAMGTHEVLTASTAFVSGRRAGMGAPGGQRLVRSPVSPRRASARDSEDEDAELGGARDAEPDDTSVEAAHQTEPEDEEPHPAEQNTGIPRRESSLPLELGRERRARERAKASASPQRDLEPEHESEDEAQPRATPPRERGRGKAATARRGRGRGRGKGTSVTPRTPREPPAASVSPQRTTSSKKRARAPTAGDASPAKKPRTSGANARAGPSGTSAAATVAEPLGTRVLAWWKGGGDYYFGSISGPGSKPNNKDKPSYSIRFDDGLAGLVPLERLRQGAALRIGDRVMVHQRFKGGIREEGIVVDIKKWKTEHIAQVAMGAEGLGDRMDAESAWLKVATPEIAKSWGDRTLDEGMLIVPSAEARPAPTPVPAKRKAGTAAASTGRGAGGKLAGFAFLLTLKDKDISEIEGKKLDTEAFRTMLQAKIEDQGGVVADEWDELFTVRGRNDAKGWYAEDDEAKRLKYVGGGKWPAVRKVFLLSGKVGMTPKYMMALALGVPCLSYQWIDEFLQDESAPWTSALLPGGRSELYGTDVSQVVNPNLQNEPDMLKALAETDWTRRPFKGMSILCIFKRAKKIQPDKNDKGRFLSRVACVMGAVAVHLVYDASGAFPRDVEEYDYVICETAGMQEQMEKKGARCRSFDWVKQCIIMGKAIPVS